MLDLVKVTEEGSSNTQNGDSCLRRCYNNVFIAGGLDLVYIFDVVRNMRDVCFVLPSVRNEIRLYYPTSTGTS